MTGKRKGAKTPTTGEKRATRATTKTPAAAPTATAETTNPSSDEVVERGMSDVDQMLLDLGARVEGTDPEQATAAEQPMDATVEIDPLATYWTELDLFCRDCSITHYVSFCTLLNAEESPHLVERAKANQMNYKRCPLCKKIEYVQHPWTFFDPQRKLVVQIRPQWEWHAGGGEEWYAARLEDLFDKWSEQDVQLDVVFGPEQFIERYLREEEDASRES